MNNEQRDLRASRGLIRDTVQVAGIRLSKKTLFQLAERLQPELTRFEASQDRSVLVAAVNAIPVLLQRYLQDALAEVPPLMSEPEKIWTIQRIIQLSARRFRLELPLELENELVGVMRQKLGDREFDLVVIDEVTATIRQTFRASASVLKRYSKPRLQEALKFMTPAERNEVVAILTGGACKKCGSHMPADEPKGNQGA